MATEPAMPKVNIALSDRTGGRIGGRLLAICAALALGQFALVTSTFMLTGLLATIAGDFHIGIGPAGQVLSAFSLSYAVASPILASLTATYPRRMLLMGSLAAFCAANLAAWGADSFSGLIIARIIAAAADGLFAATAASVAVSLAPAGTKGRVLAFVNSGVTLAFVVGVPLGSIVGAMAGWRSSFVMVSVFGAIALAGLWIVLPRLAGTTTPVRIQDRLRVLASPPVLAALSIIVLSYSGLFSVYAFLVPLLRAFAGAEQADMPGLLFAFGSATVVGNLVGGAAADRIGSVATIRLSLLVAAPLLASMPFVISTTSSAFALLAAWGLVHYAGLPALQHKIAQVAGDDAPVALALSGSAVYIGVALGTMIGGSLITTAPLLLVCFAAAILKGGALVPLWFLSRR
jgi:MFS transporter, DHA1 family, inner membrane transport protein